MRLNVNHIFLSSARLGCYIYRYVVEVVYDILVCKNYRERLNCLTCYRVCRDNLAVILKSCERAGESYVEVYLI